MKSRDFKTAEIAKFTKEEYDNYEESLKVYRDWKNTIDTAKKSQERKDEKKEGKKKRLKWLEILKQEVWLLTSLQNVVA